MSLKLQGQTLAEQLQELEDYDKNCSKKIDPASSNSWNSILNLKKSQLQAYSLGSRSALKFTSSSPDLFSWKKCKYSSAALPAFTPPSRQRLLFQIWSVAHSESDHPWLGHVQTPLYNPSKPTPPLPRPGTTWPPLAPLRSLCQGHSRGEEQEMNERQKNMLQPLTCWTSLLIGSDEL